MIRGLLPAPKPSLVISQSLTPGADGTYRVEFGDRWQDELTRDEALGMAASFLYGNSDMRFLRNQEQHDWFKNWLSRNRIPTGPVVHCPRCTRADFGVQTYHAPPACGP